MLDMTAVPTGSHSVFLDCFCCSGVTFIHGMPGSDLRL